MSEEHENQYPIFSSHIEAKEYREAKYPTIRERCEHAIRTLGKKQPESQYYIVTDDPTYNNPEKHEKWLVYIKQFYNENGTQRM